MDSENSSSGKRQRQATSKRRERSHVQLGKHNHVLDGSGGEEEGTEDHSPSRATTPKSKTKSKKRRRSSSASMEEEIIDGFAIASFKTLEDLEVGSVTLVNQCRYPSQLYTHTKAFHSSLNTSPHCLCCLSALTIF